MKRVPAIDRSECIDCDSCVEVCPKLFRRNEETGIIEVADLQDYPEDEVHEAIKMCPSGCISWVEE
jgi:ferredoxin